MARIFISYSRADVLFVEQLVPLLEQVFPDYEIWYDKHLTGGDDWWKRILDEISACDLFIYLLSNESLASDYCQAEFREGLRLQKLALPVIVRPKTNVELCPDDLKVEIKRRNWIDMSGGFKDASANGSLYRAVRLQVAKIPVQPHPPLHPDPVAQPIVIKPPSKGLDPTVVAAIIGAIALVIAAMVGITPTLVGQLRGLANPDTATFTPSSVSTTALAMVPTNPAVSATPSMALSVTSVPASATPHLTDTPKPTLTFLLASATSRPMPVILVTATAPDTPVSAEDSVSTLDAQDAQKTVAAQTLTVTLFTHTPTPTIDTSSTVNAIRTQRVMGTHVAQQTLIATRWTRTPTPSFTPTYTTTPTITPTPTSSPTVTPISVPIFTATPNNNQSSSAAPLPIATMATPIPLRLASTGYIRSGPETIYPVILILYTNSPELKGAQILGRGPEGYTDWYLIQWTGNNQQLKYGWMNQIVLNLISVPTLINTVPSTLIPPTPQNPCSNEQPAFKIGQTITVITTYTSQSTNKSGTFTILAGTSGKVAGKGCGVYNGTYQWWYYAIFSANLGDFKYGNLWMGLWE